MLFFLENLLDLPNVSIRNVIKEGKEAFLLRRFKSEVHHLKSLTEESSSVKVGC